MKYSEAREIAKLLWDDAGTRKQFALLVKGWMHKLSDPKHPFMDITEEVLTEEFGYDDHKQLDRDKQEVLKSITNLMLEAILDGR